MKRNLVVMITPEPGFSTGAARRRLSGVGCGRTGFRHHPQGLLPAPPPPRVLEQAARLLTLTHRNNYGSQMADAEGGQTLCHREMRGLVQNLETLCHSWPLYWRRTAWLRDPLAEATRAAPLPMTAPWWLGILGQLRPGRAGWASGGENRVHLTTAPLSWKVGAAL